MHTLARIVRQSYEFWHKRQCDGALTREGPSTACSLRIKKLGVRTAAAAVPEPSGSPTAFMASVILLVRRRKRLAS